MISPLEINGGSLEPPGLSEDRRIGPGNPDGSRGVAITARPDRLTISEEAREKALAMMGKKAEKTAATGKLENNGKGPAGELTEDEKKAVQELKKRDREVRAHEMAHMAASGGHSLGGPTYEYQRGPDGVQYAVGGEVQIDTSPVKGDPRATIAKAQTIKAAALAPAEPSGADRAVAAAAAAMEAEARAQISEQAAKGEGDSEGTQAPQTIAASANAGMAGSRASGEAGKADEPGSGETDTRRGGDFARNASDNGADLRQPVLNFLA